MLHLLFCCSRAAFTSDASLITVTGCARVLSDRSIEVYNQTISDVGGHALTATLSLALVIITIDNQSRR